jgi:hypothetical protein
MGQEIQDSHFSREAFRELRRRLDRETALLRDWEQGGRLRGKPFRLGFELEGWLVDATGMPAPRNRDFLEQVNDPEVVPELALFNFEINDAPLDFLPGMFDRMYRSLLARWEGCERAARVLDMQALSIGILPTLGHAHLHLGNISAMSRYHALNEQVFRQRGGEPIELHIEGAQILDHLHHDVMLESATTSLQIHLQIGSEYAVRAFNSAKMVSAATVAVGANSPFFLQRRLWEETRIPVFEQAIAVGASDYSRRVTFGVRYARDSVLECFEANRLRYPVLLPDLMDEPPERLAHLRLHNGTIWRWNRPLVGFDAEGEPHYRIEHRVVAAGTSALDVVADTAFFVGLMMALIHASEPPESRLPFARAHAGFYAAARHGLQARVDWLGGERGPLRALILKRLLPLAGEGLRAMGLAADEIRHWLGIIEARVRTGRTGSAWQRAWVERHGEDWSGLVQAYARRQALGQAVHEWKP